MPNKEQQHKGFVLPSMARKARVEEDLPMPLMENILHRRHSLVQVPDATFVQPPAKGFGQTCVVPISFLEQLASAIPCGGCGAPVTASVLRDHIVPKVTC
jgi:hypothetical protein